MRATGAGGAGAGGDVPGAKRARTGARAAAGVAAAAPGLLDLAAAGTAQLGERAHKQKRGWKRWDAVEEAALRQAVEELGTKDWVQIHQRMQTQRSIKQLQDHWNDTKHERKQMAKA